MENILYFLLWAGAFFLMMRLGCGSHVMGHGHAQRGSPHTNAPGLRWIAPGTDTDPVCGMTVQTRSAKSAVHEGRVFYFCSRDCRERFEAVPESYLAADRSTPAEKEHHHG